MVEIRKKILSLIIAMAMTLTGFGSMGALQASAADGDMGGLLWYFKDTEGIGMQGVSAPVVDGDYVYMASGKVLYKISAATGELVGKASLSGSIGYNKIAPTIADGKVFVPLGGAKLDIVDVSDMSVKKSITYADGQTSHQSLTPVVYSATDHAVYLGSWKKNAGGTFVRVSLKDNGDSNVDKLTDSATGFYWAGACADGNYIVFGSNSNGTDDNTPAKGDAVLYAYNKSKEPGESDAVLTETLKDSGSICSTVVSYNGKYYFTSKAGRLYEAYVIDGKLQAEVKAELSVRSTCTPIITDDGRAYVGTSAGVQKINLESGNVEASYSAPADVKFLTLSGDKIYCTYNKAPGGIYVISTATGAGSNYFIPHSSMQNYCISSVAQKDGVLYFTNDSNNLMAVKDAGKLITAKWDGADSSGKIADRAYTGAEQKPKIIVTYDGKTLEQGDEGYDVDYYNHKYPGTATAVVKGTGSYEGTVILNFNIKSPIAAQKTVTAQLTPTYGHDDITVKWSTQKVTGATVKYKVEYQKYGGSWYTRYYGTTVSAMTKNNLSDGVRYRFRVTPYVVLNGKTYTGASGTSPYVYTLKSTKKPVVSKASSSYVKVSWSKVYGISGYKVYRSKYSSKNFKLVKTVTSNYTYAKIKTYKNVRYYYKVRPYKKVGTKYVYGPLSTVSKSYILK